MAQTCISPTHSGSCVDYIILRKSAICRSCLVTSQQLPCQSRNHEYLLSHRVVSSGFGAMFESRLPSPNPATFALNASNDAFSHRAASPVPVISEPTYQYVCDDGKIRCTNCITAMIREQKHISGMQCAGPKHTARRDCYPLFSVSGTGTIVLYCSMCLAEGV